MNPFLFVLTCHMRSVGKHLGILFLFFSSALMADTTDTSTYSWNLPAWMSPPMVPEQNPMSAEKVTLGKRLFYDANLSGLGYMSCSSCHIPKVSFTDQKAQAVGIKGDRHLRNSMALVNVGYMKTLNWADPKTQKLEQQALIPLFGHKPIIEMAVAGHEERVLLFLQRDPIYPNLFKAAFGENASIDFDNIAKALASFQRTLISHNSPYDQYHYAGDKTAISAAAERGSTLFFSDELGCANCHSQPHFTNATEEISFHNTGLYNEDGKGAYPIDNQGLFEHTQKAEDKGRFRTPTLRNIALTAPYMHDGSAMSLAEVIRDYAAGGRSARNGKTSPLTDERIKPFSLTSEQEADLIAFLESLTDLSFVHNLAYDTPFK